MRLSEWLASGAIGAVRRQLVVASLLAARDAETAPPTAAASKVRLGSVARRPSRPYHRPTSRGVPRLVHFAPRRATWPLQLLSDFPHVETHAGERGKPAAASSGHPGHVASYKPCRHPQAPASTEFLLETKAAVVTGTTADCVRSRSRPVDPRRCGGPASDASFENVCRSPKRSNWAMSRA